MSLQANAPVIVFEPPSDEVFRLFQTLIFRTAGIHLGPEKKALLQARLSRRMRDLRLPSFLAYYRFATKGPTAQHETQTLVDLITTNETSFFRESRHFDFLRDSIIPHWRREHEAGARPPHVRVWSAGCSTGEEPFSIAMVLADELDASWQIDILASDISTRVLQQAAAATWPIERAAQIAPHYRNRFMLRGVGSSSGLLKATPELRRLIRFEHINLTDDAPDHGGFDLIFCRNVLIYFAPETKRGVIRMLLQHLSPSGHLFLGHAETLAEAGDAVRCAGPNIYRRRTGS